MAQRTVMKVDLSCQKCKKKFIKSVSALEGVDAIEVDAAKGTLNVTGSADPYKIMISVRKAAGKYVEVVSVGPAAPPPKPKPAKEPKKAEDKKGGGQKKKEKADEQALVHDPRTCRECERFVFVPLDHSCYEPSPLCCIM